MGEKNKFKMNAKVVLSKEKIDQAKELLYKLSSLEEKKVKKLPKFMEDWNKLTQLFNKHIKEDKEYVEYLVNTLDLLYEEDGIKYFDWSIGRTHPLNHRDFLLGDKQDDKFEFLIKTVEFEIGYGTRPVFQYANGVLNIGRFKALWPWNNFFKFKVGKAKAENLFVGDKIETTTTLIEENLTDEDLHNALVDTIDNFIPRISIVNCQAEPTLLTALNTEVNKFLPTVITYIDKDPEDETSQRKKQQEVNPTMFLLSIPKYSSLKEVNKYFSKSIAKMHSKFFSTRRGRPKTKEFYQAIFNRELYNVCKSSKRKPSLNAACQKVANIFKNKYGKNINWNTLKRDYYPEYKRTISIWGRQKFY